MMATTAIRSIRKSEHALCNAHILRELRYLHEHEKQTWAKQMETHLLNCHTTVEEAKALGETSLPSEVIEQLTTKYRQLIQTGLAAQPPPQPIPKQRGRVKPALGQEEARIEWFAMRERFSASWGEEQGD